MSAFISQCSFLGYGQNHMLYIFNLNLRRNQNRPHAQNKFFHSKFCNKQNSPFINLFFAYPQKYRTFSRIPRTKEICNLIFLSFNFTLNCLFFKGLSFVVKFFTFCQTYFNFNSSSIVEIDFCGN